MTERALLALAGDTGDLAALGKHTLVGCAMFRASELGADRPLTVPFLDAYQAWRHVHIQLCA